MQKTFSKKDIASIAQEVLKDLEPKKGEKATVVTLSGNLGAGKTTFTQALAHELGITENVISPTFVIMKSYPIKKSKSFAKLIHIDAYRLDSHKELEKLGWAEVVANPDNLILVEWPEKVPEAIPGDARRLTIAHRSEDERDMHFD